MGQTIPLLPLIPISFKEDVRVEKITITFRPDRRLSKNGISRAHWTTTSGLKRKAREDAYVLGLIEKGKSWQTPETCRVRVRQYYCGKPFDWDGLATLCGPFIDGLVDAGVLPEDDDPQHVLEYTMTAERVKTRAEGRVTIEVEAVSK